MVKLRDAVVGVFAGVMAGSPALAQETPAAPPETGRESVSEEAMTRQEALAACGNHERLAWFFCLWANAAGDNKPVQTLPLGPVAPIYSGDAREPVVPDDENGAYLSGRERGILEVGGGVIIDDYVEPVEEGKTPDQARDQAREESRAARRGQEAEADPVPQND